MIQWVKRHRCADLERRESGVALCFAAGCARLWERKFIEVEDARRPQRKEKETGLGIEKARMPDGRWR
jgi:hypothetical protein